MTKQTLRQLYKQKRSDLSASQKMKLDDLLLIQLQRLALPADIETLLSYWPLEQQSEPNTHIYNRYLQFVIPNLRIAYPVVDVKKHEMKAAHAHDETTFIENHFGIQEPDHSTDEIIAPYEIDLIFVPLLAFDTNGFRVGYGKGYYDKYLANCRPDVCKIGFSYFEAIDKIEDTNQYDVPLNYCITPERNYEF